MDISATGVTRPESEVGVNEGQTEYGFHLRRGCAATEQFFGDPQVGDAPIRVRKALGNVKAVQPSLIDGSGLASRECMIANRT